MPSPCLVRVLLAGFCGLLVSLVHQHVAAGQEWTRFRGPNGSGESEATTIPTTWSDRDYNWRIDLPGRGHSSPVLWGNRLYVTSAKDDEGLRILMCINSQDGSVFWKKEFPGATQKIHTLSSFASSTPAVDRDHVYFAMATAEHYHLFALTHEGNEVWQVDLGPFISQHGFGTSPIVYDDLVIINNDQDADSSLVAVDRQTGVLRWKVARQTAVVAYSTPCIFRGSKSAPELIFNSEAHGMSSVDPVTGHVNWELKTFDKRSVSSPIIAGGFIFGSCGSGGGGNFVVAVRPGPNPEIAYKIDRSAPYVPSAVAKGDLVFLWADNGIVSCIKAADGEVLWQKRVGGNFHGSPIRVGDHLYCCSAEGDAIVLKAGPEYELVSRQSLNETCRSTPAVAGGKMYLRTQSHLMSLGGK